MNALYAVTASLMGIQLAPAPEMQRSGSLKLRSSVQPLVLAAATFAGQTEVSSGAADQSIGTNCRLGWRGPGDGPRFGSWGAEYQL